MSANDDQREQPGKDGQDQKVGSPPPSGPPAHTPVLRELRQTLDKIDEELVGLVARRMETVARVIREKKGQTGGIRDSKREGEILRRVESLARQAGVAAPLARKIFSEILAHSVSRQASTLTGLGAEAGEAHAPKVGFVGTPNTYNHLAAEKFMAEIGQEGEFIGRPSIKEVVAELESGGLDLVLLNIESTAAGSLNQVYNVLRERDLHIVGEEIIKVDLCLCTLADIPLNVIERVYSHPLALEQSSMFLEALPNARPVPATDTAEAMRLVAKQGDPTHAAIGSPEGAEAHGLMVLRRGIGNHEEILHRYVVLARTPTRFDPRIPCRTSLILSTRHEKGALLRCLEALSEKGVSLTKLESRPNPDRPWEYMFFVDFEGNTSEPRVASAVTELRARALFLKVLGCYPAKANPTEAHLPTMAGGASGTSPALAGGRTPPPVILPPANAPSAALPAVAPPMHPAEATEATEQGPPGGDPGSDQGPGQGQGHVTRTGPGPTPEAAVGRPARPHRLADRATRREDTLVRVGDLLIGGTGFVVMAGPGSVESEGQILETARFVRGEGAHVLRGGVLRPHASPYGFPGLGLPGLALLTAAGRRMGMPVVTEVLAPEDVRPVAEQADILQVGALNMQNYALLRELGKVNRPVLLKRGVAATVDEWLAAAEQILGQGNGQVILCERGIRTFETATPSTLDLSAVVVLKQRTHLPVVVDPSQAAGNRDYVAPLAWAARACGAHGVLVEVHPDPPNALADGEQSLDFPGFNRLMSGLGRWRP